MSIRIWFSLVAVLALGATACGGSSDEGAREPFAAIADPVEQGTAVPIKVAETEPKPAPTVAPASTAEPVSTVAPTPAPAEQPSEPAAVLGSGCGAGNAPGITTVAFESDGRDRIYEQVVPASYDDLVPMAVVLNWHGLGSNGFEQIAFSDYAALAEAEGFIVIAPTGLPSEEGRNSWELAPDQDLNRDDLAFANEVLDRVIETLCIDDTRVYTTGMSNGGYFSSVLVCEMSDRIAAAASVAALTHADDCAPSRTVPYIGFHGTDDEVVPYAGRGVSSLAPGQIVPLFELKILDEFTEFAVEAGCEAEPVITEFSDNVTSFDFANCVDAVTMTFYEIDGAGHTWPGSLVSIALSEALGLGVTTDEISASETSWAFFEQYSLDS